ncbi:ROK family protein [Labrys monachus]|uniref:NBD/HSP70 family sugar kinase n=1 Tax=Labrys monachus TaxID=217067 RepID=A0ABU0FJU8_9HYPH|nr:ROK family protein [Labrys monachus]MDQ0394622.1 putative NBD/HSP70 family sugar kinase [Labrys monachus]
MASGPTAERGLTSARIRHYHYRIVLQRLRRLREASKADLARAANLTNTAIGEIVADLRGLGLISVIGKRYQGQRGQPATLLRLEPTGAYGIGVRIDRNRIETALVDLGGRLIDKRSHCKALPSPEETLALVTADVEALHAHADSLSPGRVLGIGLAQPYNLGAWLDRLHLDGPTLALWDDFDFAAALRASTGLDVHAENDGTAAAIAELFYGFGRESDDFVYFFIGPAVGGGVVLAGDYRRGIGGNAGDVAMLPVPASRLPSAPPPSGPYDILLARASIAALMRHLAWRGHAVARLSDLPAAIEACPDGFEEWLADCVEALVGPVLSAQALLDVPNVVLDGDLGTPIMEEIARRLRIALVAAIPEARSAPVLRLGTFGSNAHALGAASLPLFIDFAPRATVLDNARPVTPKGEAHAH